MDILKKIINEELSKSLLICEVTIKIEDLKKQGYATQIGKMYADELKPYMPLSVEGVIGLSGHEYQELLSGLGINLDLDADFSGNYFKINFKNGDIVEVVRNSNPAVAYIFNNKNMIAKIDNPNELFKNSLPELTKKYYSNQISPNNNFEN